MPVIQHYNYADRGGQVYCCLRNKVVKADDKQIEEYCNGCKMFSGTISGQGLTCAWEDVRDIDNPHVVHDPWREYFSNQIKLVKPKNLGLNIH
ncbi:MAG: hypothetical protein A2189_04620, partial [Paenibacillus sp. RIFOXYA1_FULL_44_5]